MNVKTTALTLGSFAALVHLLWSLFVATGLAQGIVNWRLALHFVTLPVAVAPFDLVNAITLVVLAFIGGAVIGGVLATLWNHFSK